MAPANRRYSTIHDLATLRLHPDGSRVANTEANRRSKKDKRTVQDARGNWIARDAGGHGRVKKRRKAVADDTEGQDDVEEEVIDLTQVGSQASASTKDKGKRKLVDDEELQDEPEDAESAVKDVRAKKRRRFEQDLSFLETISTAVSIATTRLNTPAPTVQLPIEASSLEDMPNPSSDLLKYIHYYASVYYDEMGHLYDATRDARRVKRRNKRLRILANAGISPGNINEEDLVRSSDEETTDDEEEGEGEAIDRAEDEDEGEEDLRPATQEGSDWDEDPEQEEGREEECEEDGEDMEEEDGEGEDEHDEETEHSDEERDDKDMYKIFHGSSLMLIGFLIQEYVKQLVIPAVPPGWEEAMLAQEKKQGERNRRRRMRRLKHENGNNSDGEAERAENAQQKGEGEEDEGEEEEEEEDERAKDASDAGDAVNTRTRTRGITRPIYEVPYVDADDDDEDFVP